MTSLLAILSRLSYRDWQFRAGELGEGFFVQVRFSAAGEQWSGRKWYVSSHATQSEVVQTALMAVLAAEEHEARERFLYEGKAIFQPHHSLSALLAVADVKEVR